MQRIVAWMCNLHKILYTGKFVRYIRTERYVVYDLIIIFASELHQYFTSKFTLESFYSY